MRGFRPLRFDRSIPSENKILKLYDRARKLESLGITVVKVIFSKAEQQMFREIAVPREIIIVAQSLIEEMFEMASRGATTKEIYYRMSQGSMLALPAG